MNIADLRAQYPEVAPHFQAESAKWVKAIYKADSKKKQGHKLFHLFQKLIARPDVLSNASVRALATHAHSVLNEKHQKKKLSKAPASQLEGANIHFATLLKGEQIAAKEAHRFASTLEEMHTLFPNVFAKGVDVLVASYAELNPKVHREIEAELRRSRGFIDDALYEKLLEHGTRFGDLIPTLDLHGVDLVAGRLPPAAPAGTLERELREFADTFSHLKKLNIANCNINAHVVAGIADLPELEELDISQSDPALFNGFQMGIGSFDRLRVLRWDSSNLHGHSFLWLPVIPSLRHFSCREMQFWDGVSIERLNTCFPTLEILDISGAPYMHPSTMQQFIPTMRCLRKLVVQNCPQFDQGAVRNLRAQFPHIEIVG